ncbi:MAG: hypothetical protein ACF788_04760, partial [Novipirellula sp. JB048]
DAAIAKNQQARLSGFVSLLGADAGKLKSSALELATRTSATEIPFVVAKEANTGPLNYRLAIDAPVTVVVANDSQVVSSRVFAADAIDIETVLSDIQSTLN